MDNELYHHGIKGQKWGIRRYRNADGTLTPAGRRRWAKITKKAAPHVRDMARAKIQEEMLRRTWEQNRQDPNNGAYRAMMQRYGQDYARAVSRLQRLGLENPAVSIREHDGQTFVLGYVNDPATRMALTYPMEARRVPQHN